MDTGEEMDNVMLRPTRQAKELTFKLILLGDSSVGKTSLLRRYANEEAPTGVYKPTIGVDFRTKQLAVEGEHVRALIWDTAGQERFKTMTKQYYRGSHGVVLVYDVSNADSFQHVERWMRDFQKFTDSNSSAQKILVGNKSDVKEKEREVTFEQGQLLGIELDVPHIETSAKDNVNVTEMFEKIITNLVIKRRERNSMLPSPSPSPRHSFACSSNGNDSIILNLNDETRKKKSRCCYDI